MALDREKNVDILAAYSLETVKALRSAGPLTRNRLLDGGVVLAREAEAEPSPMWPTMLIEAADEFEFWIMERWLAAVRKKGWRDSPKGRKMRELWELER